MRRASEARARRFFVFGSIASRVGFADKLGVVDSPASHDGVPLVCGVNVLTFSRDRYGDIRGTGENISRYRGGLCGECPFDASRVRVEGNELHGAAAEEHLVKR